MYFNCYTVKNKRGKKGKKKGELFIVKNLHNRGFITRANRNIGI